MKVQHRLRRRRLLQKWNNNNFPMEERTNMECVIVPTVVYRIASSSSSSSCDEANEKFQKCRKRLERVHLELKSFLWVTRPEAWRLLPLFVSFWVQWYDLPNPCCWVAKSISFGWFIVEPKLCARRTKNFYLLFWFKRREMSMKWFRTSSSVLKSCCSMNHIYLHREPLSNAPASSNTFDIAQVAS